MRVPAWLGSGEGSLPGVETAIFLLCAHMVARGIERGRKLPDVSSYKGIHHIMGVLPHDLI